MTPETKYARDLMRRGIRGEGVFSPMIATPDTLRTTADAIDTLAAHDFDHPEYSVDVALRTADENGVVPHFELGFARAERLRLLADKMEREEAEVNERLAQAGAAAAEAEKTAENLKHHRNELQQQLSAARAEIEELQIAAYDGTAEHEEIVAQLTEQRDEAIRQLLHERERLRIAQRVIGSLVMDIENARISAESDTDLVFQVGAPVGLTPGQAHEIIVAAALDSELVGIES